VVAGDGLEVLAGLAIALGIGLLVGVERERHAGGRPKAAGVRTFAIVAFSGALAYELGDTLGLAMILFVVGAIAVAGYLRTGAEEGFGLTTESAMIAVVLLGALATALPTVAAGAGVVLAILLRSRSRLHSFATDVLTADELWDALVFLAAALVILPLAPAEPIGPQGVLVPRSVIELALAVMGISAAGHIARRWAGPRYGLPIAGFAAGFVSSAATVGSMGGHAKRHPEFASVATAGAVLSTVATFVQMAIVLWVASPAVLLALAWPLAWGGMVAAGYGVLFTWRAVRSEKAESSDPGRAFDLRWAVGYALIVSAVIVVAAFVESRLGQGGLTAVTGLAGFADAHSAPFSAASVVASRGVAEAAVVPVLVAMTTNTVTKIVVAVSARRCLSAVRFREPYEAVNER
jgi:uncharacterized membrane protein (DUF4010 family)